MQRTSDGVERILVHDAGLTCWNCCGS
jgi:hypothetical protein